MDTRQQGKQNRKTDLTSILLIETEEEVPKIMPVKTVMEKISDRGHIIETGEAILPVEVDIQL